MDADATTITISGYSAGAYFAHRVHVVFSEDIKGVAAFCGVPYIDPLYDWKGNADDDAATITSDSTTFIDA